MTDTKPDSVKVLRDLADHIEDTRGRIKRCSSALRVVEISEEMETQVSIKGIYPIIGTDLVVKMLKSELDELEAELAAAEYAAHLCVDRAQEVLDEPQ